MTVALIWDPALSAYRFPGYHPMSPERFSLAVDLMRAWGLLAEEVPADELPADHPVGGSHAAPHKPRAAVWAPALASEDDLLLFHTREYVDAVMAASADPRKEAAWMGLGPGDTPTFAGMHEAAALAVGGTTLALDAVLDRRAARTFNPAGGLHHAMPNRASGFCIYNDCAVAIERATRAREGLRVAYVDVDAHHGDGVQAAFWERPDVLTLSVHESGRFLFPGTGDAEDIGAGAGLGACVNVPLPPDAGPDCYALVLGEVVEPAIRAFNPDVVIAQLGADSLAGDPLTHLRQTMSGYVDTVAGITRLAEEVCDGRLVFTGGGGYQPFSAVPRAWAAALAVLLGTDVPRTVPPTWAARAAEAAADGGVALPDTLGTFDEDARERGEEGGGDCRAMTEEPDSPELRATREVIDRVSRASPLLGGVR